MALGIGTLWAVLAAMAASMVVGFIWYAPVWGRKYMSLTGMDRISEEEKKAAQKGAMWGYVSTLVTVGVATVVIAFLFDWAFEDSGYSSKTVFGIALGASGWLAFYVPGSSTNRFFLPERPPVALWWINGIYWLLVAALSGLFVGLFA